MQNYAHTERVPAINADRLVRAMDGSQVTPKQLAERVGKSLTYVCDITAGRRTLKRNPQLRAAIAEALGVPRDWIEHPRPEQVEVR